MTFIVCCLAMAALPILHALRPPYVPYKGSDRGRGWISFYPKPFWRGGPLAVCSAKSWKHMYFNLGIGERAFILEGGGWAYGAPLIGVTSRGISIGFFGWKDDLGRKFKRLKW